MNRRLTPGEARWPETPEFSGLANAWQLKSTTIMLGMVWEGVALFCADVLSQIDITLADEQLERSVTQFLTPKIRACTTGFEPFDVEQGVYEYETRVSSSAQPPLYDIAFVLKSNPRIMWPLEAKVIKADGDVGRYIDELVSNFLTCRYAPFTGEGAMLGYLKEGNPSAVFRNIELKLPCKLADHPDFASHNHRTSVHLRKVPATKHYPVKFCCHHLIMRLKQ